MYGVSSMTAPLKRVALRRPGHALLNADASVWHYGPSFDPQKVAAEHDCFAELLNASGAEILWMDSDDQGNADAVFTYDSDTLAADILDATRGAGVDLAVEVEFGLNIGMLSEVMVANGRVAIYGSAKDMTPTLEFGPLLFKALKLDIALVYILPDCERQAAISKLHEALHERALSFPTPYVFAPEDAAAAHEMVETGGRAGAVLVSFQ